jgi:hypothetical protein
MDVAFNIAETMSEKLVQCSQPGRSAHPAGLHAVQCIAWLRHGYSRCCFTVWMVADSVHGNMLL